MRTIFALALLLAACGGDDGIKNGNGSVDAASDLAGSVSVDLATAKDLSSGGVAVLDGGGFSDLGSADLAGVSCGSMSCGTGTSCCIDPNNGSPTYSCAATCGTGGIVASCDGPEDCSTGTCCATVTLSSTTSASGNAMCSSPTNDCSTGNLDLGSRTITTKLCHQPSDCANYSGNYGDFTSCCSYPNVSYSFCAPGLANGQMGITCQ